MIINLKFDSDEARLLVVENHICEIQLLLRSLAPPQVPPCTVAMCETSCPHSTDSDVSVCNPVA